MIVIIPGSQVVVPMEVSLRNAGEPMNLLDHVPVCLSPIKGVIQIHRRGPFRQLSVVATLVVLRAPGDHLVVHVIISKPEKDLEILKRWPRWIETVLAAELADCLPLLTNRHARDSV